MTHWRTTKSCGAASWARGHHGWERKAEGERKQRVPQPSAPSPSFATHRGEESRGRRVEAEREGEQGKRENSMAPLGKPVGPSWVARRGARRFRRRMGGAAARAKGAAVCVGPPHGWFGGRRKYSHRWISDRWRIFDPKVSLRQMNMGRWSMDGGAWGDPGVLKSWALISDPTALDAYPFDPRANCKLAPVF
jgi:hypothetical protein